MFQFLSIDPATSSGWCILNSNKELLKYGFYKPDNTDMGKELSDIYMYFCNIITNYKFDCVFIEDFKVGKMVGSAEKSYAIRGVLRMLCSDMNVRYEIINISEWKKSLIGKTQPTKQDKKQYGKDAGKILTKNVIQSRYNIPDRIEGKTKNGIATPYDIFDSVGIGLHGIDIFLRKKD